MGHIRLRHPFEIVVKLVLALYNLSRINKSLSHVCSTYCLGKIQKFPFPLMSKTTSSEPLQLIH